MHRSIARIALDVPVASLFDFDAPGITRADIGRLAVIPFGKRRTVGVILDMAEESAVPTEKLRAVDHVVLSAPALSKNDLALFRFCAGYYHHPLGQVILNALPAQFRSSRPFRLAPVAHYQLTPIGCARKADDFPKRAVTQRRVFDRMLAGPTAESVLTEDLPRAKAALQALLERGWIERVAPRLAPSHEISPPPYELNEAQRNAVGEIEKALGSYRPFLLSGVTGSGKTEVYLSAIERVLARGGQALVLVPEINLTPQLEMLFRKRFPAVRLVSMHSHLARMPRLLGWLDAQSGRAQIVLGTRLAVFTPLPQLGLIVVDEEQDPSFKQQEGLRYSARDVAVYRARLAECPVILGSATPSLESWYNTQLNAQLSTQTTIQTSVQPSTQTRASNKTRAGARESQTNLARYTLLYLSRRAVPGAAMPAVKLIDTGKEPCREGVTDSLLAALKLRLERGEQSLLFINRRGYSPALVCQQCAWMPECPHCAARLIFHKSDGRMRCHHCGHQSRIPPHCGSCGSAALVPAGQGTQRIESLIEQSFPRVRIARVDRDSTRARGAAQRIFDNAHRGEIDILVGTQMLAKGHDFPNLTLVGVLNSDAAMFSADFRAPERLFAQLVQVAGRAGRADRPGEVLVQTAFPGHPIYAAAQKQDYARFAQLQLEERRLSTMPPFSYLALLRVEARTAGHALRFADQALEMGRALKTVQVTLFDAVPAPLARKAGWERAQVLVQSRSRTALQRFVTNWQPMLQQTAPRSLRWLIDIDPLEV
jgi:primosomal protein N' (replication factor Y) (superfamily II helicase)